MRIIALICCSALLVLPSPAADTSGGAQTNRSDETKRYVVMLKRTADQDRCINEHAVNRRRTFRHAINGFVADLKPNAVERLRRDSRVEVVVEDRIAAVQTAQTIPTGVLRMGVNHFPPVKIDGTDKRVDVDVAVIDSGIQLDHPDLNVVQAVDFTGNGLVDTSHSHGTSCAGVIGALDNGFGVVGVAPGVRLWSLRASTDNLFYLSEQIAAFNYVAAHADQIAVVNCSFGSFYAPPGYIDIWGDKIVKHEAVRGMVNQGVVVVAGAGNDSRDIAGPDGVLDNDDDTVPAAFAEVMTVSAMDPVTDQFADFSNFSPSRHAVEFVSSPGGAIDVAAPGVRIFVPVLGSSYGISGGTSMACPHAAGVVALYIAAHGRATNAAGVYRIRQAIIDAAQPQSSWQSTNTLDPDSFHEGLAFPSVSWLTNTPRFLSITQNASGVDLSFSTLAGYHHTVQGSESASASSGWTNLISTNGTGNPAIIQDSAELPAKFYRLATQVIPWPPSGAFLTATNIGSVGTNGNGAYIGAVPGVAGAIASDVLNPAVRMEGGSSLGRVQVPFVPELNPAGPFSVEFWTQPSATNGLVTLASSTHLVTGQRSGWVLYQASVSSLTGNGFQFRCWSDVGNNTQISARADVAIDTNAWYHVAGVYDGSNVVLYVNGTLAATTAFPAGQVLRPNPASAMIFGASYDLNFPYAGDLDEAAVYTNGLSAAQVLAHYQAGTNAAPPIPYSQIILNDNPAGYWRFDDQ